MEARAIHASNEKLPSRYAGTDPQKFYELFKCRISDMTRREFETTAEFERRTSSVDAILYVFLTIVFAVQEMQPDCNWKRGDTRYTASVAVFFCLLEPVFVCVGAA
ncbi:MAG: hypothetical protein JWM42_2901 [Burkholderia sp.]|nr:hypothetical protein [Burkholderia sp.]